MQRRRYGRYKLWFPVQLSGEGIAGMAFNHNISAGGMLMAVSAKLEVGATVELNFQIPPTGEAQRKLQGKVIRVEENAEDPEGIWPFRMAVEFEATDDELVPHLEQAATELEP